MLTAAAFSFAMQWQLSRTFNTVGVSVEESAPRPLAELIAPNTPIDKPVYDRLCATQGPQQAAALYQRWLAGSTSPMRHVVQFNLGVLYGQLQLHAQAEAAYRAAITSKPDFAQAWFNLGATVERLGRKEHALTIWQSMLDHPLVTPTHQKDLYLLVVNGMGRLLEEMRQYDRSEVKLFDSLLAEPQQPKVIQHWVHLRQKQCSWPVFTPVPGLGQGEVLKATSPLAMLSASDDPGLQLATSIRFITEKVNLRVPRLGEELRRWADLSDAELVDVLQQRGLSARANQAKGLLPSWRASRNTIGSRARPARRGTTRNRSSEPPSRWWISHWSRRNPSGAAWSYSSGCTRPDRLWRWMFTPSIASSSQRERPGAK